MKKDESPSNRQRANGPVFYYLNIYLFIKLIILCFKQHEMLSLLHQNDRNNDAD